jgi:hypothetical protein
MKKALTIVSIIGTSISSAFAQITVGQQAAGGQINGGPLLGLLALAQTILERLVPFALGLGFVGFLFFLVKFIWKGGSNPDDKKSAVAGMTYSVLALFLMVAVWGIIAVFANILGVGIGGTLPAPTLPK